MTWTPEQRRAYHREWGRKRREDPEYREKQNRGVRRWREQNPERAQDSERRSRELHREEINERSRKDYAQDPEKHREYARRYREAHLEERREYNRLYAQRNRENKRLMRFGITAEQYAELLESQGGGCALCGATPKPGKDLAIDHDHNCCPGRKSCGKCIRGVLCDKHNLALGFFSDVGQLQAAIEYLQRPMWAGQIGS
jgi:hypothetical protein